MRSPGRSPTQRSWSRSRYDRKGPAPGIKNRNALTTERPRSVPPAPASVELTSVVKKAVSMRRPKVAVMLASIESELGKVNRRKRRGSETCRGGGRTGDDQVSPLSFQPQRHPPRCGKAFFWPAGITCIVHSTRSVRFIGPKTCPSSCSSETARTNDIAGSWQKSLHFGSKTVIGARLGDHGHHWNVFGQ
jgi:hypothetical protein